VRLRGLFFSSLSIALGATLFWGIALQGELAFPSAPGASYPFVHYLEVAASTTGFILMAAGALWFGVSCTVVVLSRRAHRAVPTSRSSDERASSALTQ
jgi:hypothetical protein